jgi:hypothetical protein
VTDAIVTSIGAPPRTGPSTPRTSSILRALICVSVGNDHPSLILTSQGIYEMYETTLTNMLRTTSNVLGDAGFESLSFKGGAVTFSPSGTATNMYFLNERYLEMIIETDADFAMTDWKPIPNQLDRVAQVVTQGDVVTSNRRMQGVLTGVA